MDATASPLPPSKDMLQNKGVSRIWNLEGRAAQEKCLSNPQTVSLASDGTEGVVCQQEQQQSEASSKLHPCMLRNHL